MDYDDFEKKVSKVWETVKAIGIFILIAFILFLAYNMVYLDRRW